MKIENINRIFRYKISNGNLFPFSLPLKCIFSYYLLIEWSRVINFIIKKIKIGKLQLARFVDCLTFFFMEKKFNPLRIDTEYKDSTILT